MSAGVNFFDGRSGTVVQVGTLNGSVELGQRTRRAVRLVPAITSVFRDRMPEFATLDAWAERAEEGGSRLWNITGPSGIGKTTLALTWINENRHRFDHAQIAMECGGGPGEGRGRSVEEVCDRYFALAGMAQAAGTPAAKMELLSSLIEGEKVALLLDDVQSAAQVLPFLSNLPGVLVISTSRLPLAGLAQYQPQRLSLASLPDEAVMEMLVEIVGADRVAAEPEATAELVRLCAGLPILASHAAGLLHDDWELRLSDLTHQMAVQGRLTALEAGHDDPMARPSAVFEVMYRELGAPAAQLYRALGLHPVRDFDPGLVAALFSESPGDGVAGLEQLKKRGMVKSDQRHRYLMEDLTYEHAALAARRDLDPAVRTWLRSRIADYYLYGAIAASRHLSQRWTLSPLYEQTAPFPLPEFALSEGQRDPIAWIGDNLAAIMACMERVGRVWEGTGLPRGYRWQMAEATHAYFTVSGRSDERATVLAWAEEDADACQNPDAQARIQAQWGEMLLGQGRLEEAEQRFQRSLEAAEAGIEYRGIGAALEWLGITERRCGNPAAALEYFDRAMPFLDPARPRSQALLQMHRGDAHAVLGDVPAALERYAAATALFRRLADEGRRDHVNEGKVLMGQAELLVRGRPRQARALFEEALTLFQTARRPYQEAKVWEVLGDLGDGAAAWQNALELYESVGAQEASERVRVKLQ
ncbi:tetratricopeptide repeat protein [Nonomuraea sp. NN258]|uniref:tetratricopeptide repeat protein n=1 Tax=Nonomuraea antri TaxID=2730852 RepID=UPI001568C92B|nr:tetratricopeptide repeat protein [Nonomuraea antri]NRQ32126.1 tetratricopeptide repeat protein [Nonomuraea antri]